MNQETTSEERKVLEAICAGKSNEQILSEFGVTKDVLQKMIKDFYAKTGCTNRLMLAIWAVKNNLL